MIETLTNNGRTKPTALAIPKEGFVQKEQGRYVPIFPKMPAIYGFTIIARIKPDTKEVFYDA